VSFVIVCAALPFYLVALWFAHRLLLRRAWLSRRGYWLAAIAAASLPVLVIVLETGISALTQYDGNCYVWTDISFSCSLPATVLAAAGFALIWSIPLLFVMAPFVALVFALGWDRYKSIR